MNTSLVYLSREGKSFLEYTVNYVTSNDNLDSTTIKLSKKYVANMEVLGFDVKHCLLYHLYGKVRNFTRLADFHDIC